MHANGTTPDGYLTDAQGHWIGEDGSAHYEAGKGLSSTPQSTSSGISRSSGGSGGGSGSGSGGGSGSSSSGGSGSGNAGNNGSTGNEGGNGSIDGETSATPRPTTLLNEQRTRVVDLGWAQYAVAAFQTGTIEDYEILIDGTNITDACTRVDDAGTIVKWELTALNPGELTAVRNSDGKEQTVTIGNGAGAASITAGNSESAPAYIMSNGPVSIFDYWLDNYDKDGNVRVEPSRTTFAVNGVRDDSSVEIPESYYAPDALIDENGKGDQL